MNNRRIGWWCCAGLAAYHAICGHPDAVSAYIAASFVISAMEPDK